MRQEITAPIAVPSLLKRWKRESRTIAWLGSLSFEERCSGSLREFASKQLKVDRGFLLDYASDGGSAEEERRRSYNREVVLHIGEDTVRKEIENVPIRAYSFDALRRSLQRAIKAGVDAFVLDVTCMTKLHVMALAAAVAEWPKDIPWVVAYTVPENYGHMGKS